MRRPIRVAMLIGAAGALTLGGTTAALAALGGSQEPQASTSYSAPSTASPAGSPAAAGRVTAERARQIAQQRVPGSTVTETEFDHEHGRAVWEVGLTRQHRDYEVHIDAATGKIVSVSGAAAVAPGAAVGASPAAAGRVTAERARQIAQQRVPGSTVTETEFDHEHGRAVWEVGLTRQHRDYEVHIDAATGNVLSVHYDTDAGDDH